MSSKSEKKRQMSTSTITRPGDIVVKSIECYNRLIVDRNCNLDVPNVHVDDSLTVDIGGNVNMPATTVDFTNSTINFTGASIVGLSGNITGNLSFTGNLIADTLIATKVYADAFCGGTMIGTTIKATTSFMGPLMGDVCGTVMTDMLMEKTMGGGITVDGMLFADVTGKLTGDSCGTHIGPVETNSIDGGGGDIVVSNGTLKGDLMGTFMGTGTGTFNGLFCGDASIGTLTPKAPNTAIMVDGDVVIAEGNVVVGNLSVETLFAGNIVSPHAVPVKITPGIMTPLVMTDSMTIDMLSVTTSITTGLISATTGCFDTLKTDSLFETTALNGIDINSDTRFNAPVCITDLAVGTMTGKSGNPISVMSNINMSSNALFADQVCSNVIITDAFVGKNGPISIDNTVADNVCANVQVLTPKIVEKVPGEGIMLQGNLMLPAPYTLTANGFVGNVAVIDFLTSDTMCTANLQVDTIYPKDGMTLTIDANTLVLTGTLTLGGTFSVQTLEVFSNAEIAILNADFGCITDLQAETLSGKNGNPLVLTGSIDIGDIVGNTIQLTGNLDAYGVNASIVSAAKFNGGDVCGDALLINGTQVVTMQQPAIADAAAATAMTLTDATGGTANQTVVDVSTTVGTVTAYVPTGGGAVTVTSSAATDLDTTQTGLATLTTEVNARLSSIDTRLGDINDNFADLTDEVDALITDVGDIRTQLNLVLAALRTHGLIDT